MHLSIHLYVSIHPSTQIKFRLFFIYTFCKKTDLHIYLLFLTKHCIVSKWLHSLTKMNSSCLTRNVEKYTFKYLSYLHSRCAFKASQKFELCRFHEWNQTFAFYILRVYLCLLLKSANLQSWH